MILLDLRLRGLDRIIVKWMDARSLVAWDVLGRT